MSSESHQPHARTHAWIWLVTLVMAQSIPTGKLPADDEPTGQAADHFHRRVEPLLRQHCYECHSHASRQMQSGLALDWRSGWEKGGDRGPAIVPGKPDESWLIRAIQHSDPELKMPERKLGDDEIAIFTEWVRQGAFDDRTVIPIPKEQESWWSLKPLRAPEIPILETSSTASSMTAVNPIDAFVLARLDEHQLALSPPAQPRDLIRRLYFDLLGLPPTAEEVASFQGDPSDEHYWRLVDQLLNSPRYGQRWARHWFDTIHFADSHGYEHDVARDNAWPYRDYVIAAFNADLPWSEFIRQQLAVDYFQPQDSHLLPALGFLGAGTFDYSTYQTGPVTFDYLDRDDMLTQTMSAFTSATANCARCHAHKFDPITQEDYYALQAVFAGIVKGDILYDGDSQVAGERQRLNELLAAAKRADESVLLSASNRQLVAAWERDRGGAANWQVLYAQSFVSTHGATLTQAIDGVILASGPAPDIDTYVVTSSSSLPRITAVRLEVLPDPSLPMQGPGRCHNGNLHLSSIKLTKFSEGQTAGIDVAIAQATADFNQAGWGIEHAIDNDPKTAWGIHPAVGQSHQAVFELVEPLELGDGGRLTITLNQLHGGAHLIGAFRLTVTDAPAPQTRPLPLEVEAALRIAPGQRSPQQQLTLASYVVTHDAQARLQELPPQVRVYAAAAQAAIPLGKGDSKPVSVAAPKPVHLLRRGEIHQPQAEIPPGALSGLSDLPSRFIETINLPESARRAALAEWLAHSNNRLTWRSIVNRVWHYHFGRGLCDTPSDFGRMGGQPTHPELLDWLAVWFRDQAGGSLKRLHRLIVTSRTYRQSSRDRADAAAIDAENRWLWRQNCWRLDADAYRDYVLVVSGRIDWSMGGPAVQHFHQSPGAQLTPILDYGSYDWATPGASRRSIYRFVWRGIPDPLMSALDFPDLGLLTPVRSESISPLQALTLLNNNFVLFHSQAMADHIVAQSMATLDKLVSVHDSPRNEMQAYVALAVQYAYQRPPTEHEQELFLGYAEQHGLSALCRVLINSGEFLFIP